MNIALPRFMNLFSSSPQRQLMQRTLQPLTSLQDRITAGHPVPAVYLKRTGIDNKFSLFSRSAVTDRMMGMSVNHTVRLGKEIPQAGLDSFGMSAQPVAVGHADGKVAELKGLLGRQDCQRVSAATVAVDRVNGFVRECLQQRDIDQITGMDNHIAVGKALFGPLDKFSIYCGEMGV